MVGADTHSGTGQLLCPIGKLRDTYLLHGHAAIVILVWVYGFWESVSSKVRVTWSGPNSGQYGARPSCGCILQWICQGYVMVIHIDAICLTGMLTEL